jgi:adenylate kinase family enzyme
LIRRVAVLGCGGAGKTVLARRLGEALHLPVIHGDLHREEWERVHNDLIAGDEWVIDAMRLGTLDARLARADAAVFVDRSAATCLVGLARRRLRYRGGLHPDSGVADFVNGEFLHWILAFRRTQRPRILALLERHAAATEIAVVRSYAESDALVSSWRTRRFGATMSQDSSTRSRSSSSAISSSRTSTAP